MKRKSIATGSGHEGGDTMARLATLMLGLAAVVAALAMTNPAHVAGSEATCLSGQIGDAPRRAARTARPRQLRAGLARSSRACASALALPAGRCPRDES